MQEAVLYVCVPGLTYSIITDFTMCFPCVCYNINKSCLRETRSIGETQHNLTPQMMHAYVLYHHNTIYYAWSVDKYLKEQSLISEGNRLICTAN